QSDLMTMVRLAMGGKEVTPYEINYLINNARRFIQNHGNLRCMQTNGTIQLSSTTGIGPYNFSDFNMANFKNLASKYISTNSNGSQCLIPVSIERVREKFIEFATATTF